jgi:hypothetical protein
VAWKERIPESGALQMLVKQSGEDLPPLVAVLGVTGGFIGLIP